MSIYSTLYDNMITRIEAVLPTHQRLHNSYALEQNNAQFLKLGYGLAINEGINSNRNVGCRLSIKQTLNVSITRKLYAREFDAVSKATTDKDLLEDALLIIKDFEINTTLNNSSSVIKFIQHSGINNIFVEKDNYLSIQLNFELELFDTLQ